MICVIVSNIIHQVTLLSSYTSVLHCCKSACLVYCLFQFITIFSNLFEFFLNLFEFFNVLMEFFSEKKGHVRIKSQSLFFLDFTEFI